MATRGYRVRPVGCGLVLLCLVLAGTRLLVRPPRLTEPFLVGHRGAAGLAPENTLAAIETALAQPVTMIEIDVRRTADGMIILMHDRTARRTTGASGNIDRLTWPALQDTVAEKGGAAISTLEEALDAVKGSGVTLVVEVKEPERAPGIAAQLIDAVRQAGMVEDVVVASTDLDWLHEIHQAAPEIGLTAIAPFALGLFRQGEIRQVAVHWLAVVLDPTLVWRLHQQDCAVLAWTVDHPGLARWLWAHGVDGIITDRPDRLAGELARAPGS